MSIIDRIKTWWRGNVVGPDLWEDPDFVLPVGAPQFVGNFTSNTMLPKFVVKPSEAMQAQPDYDEAVKAADEMQRGSPPIGRPDDGGWLIPAPNTQRDNEILISKLRETIANQEATHLQQAADIKRLRRSLQQAKARNMALAKKAGKP